MSKPLIMRAGPRVIIPWQDAESDVSAPDLNAVSTADLHRELARRTGVREIVYGPEDNVYICGNDGVIINDYGPARVLVNVD